MEFKDKYTPESIKEKDKQVISDDSYVLGEVLSDLIVELRNLRFKKK